MSDSQATGGFHLTPDEEKFFIRFMRRHAFPLSAMIGTLAGGLTAAALSCSLAPDPSPASAEVDEVLEAPGLAPALVDEEARAELAKLREEMAALRSRPTPPAAPALAQGASMQVLQRELDDLEREVQRLATAFAELERQAGRDSLPASADVAEPQLDPLRKRVASIEARQDREEAAHLEWAGNVEQRVRNLEAARQARENLEQSTLQRLMDRVHELEQAIQPRP